MGVNLPNGTKFATLHIYLDDDGVRDLSLLVGLKLTETTDADTGWSKRSLLGRRDGYDGV